MPKPKAKKRGPKADTLKLKGPLDAALTTFLTKKRPEGGWPNPPRRYKKREGELTEEE